MITVSIIGAGKVAFHLVEGLKNKENIQVKQIYSRSGFSDSYIQNFPDDIILKVKLSELEETDVYIIAVKDDAIEAVSEKIPYKNKLVVHTSGNTDINLLSNHNRKGVLYPVQSFNLGKRIDWENTPICWETTFSEDEALIISIAKSLSQKVYQLSSDQRKKLHIACVFANNFTNHIIYQAQEICNKNNIPLELISPLVQQTFQKLEDNHLAYDLQTGPAIREDLKTVNMQINSLTGVQKEIYQTLTKSILETYGREKL